MSNPMKGDYTDPLETTDNFNLLQFINETVFDSPEEDGSMVSPTSSAGSMQQQHHNGNHQHNHHNNPMFQNRRLPESPPMTDICGNGSSASSSSHSDPMFSPNEFNGYAVSSHGLILGVQDIHNNVLQQHESMQQNANRGGGNHMQQQQQQQQQQQHQQHHQTQNFWQGNGNQQNIQQNNSSSRSDISSSPIKPQYGNMDNNMLLYNMLQASHEGGLASPIIEEPISRKRSRMDTPCETPKLMQALSNIPESFGSDENYNHQQAIKFSKFQEEQWTMLYDENCRELSALQVHVVADKGFNYSSLDNCFVNQKKNHFQVSVHVEASDSMPPKFCVFNGSLAPIRDFKLAFCGVKTEMTTSEICIKQSRADRKPHPHTPVTFEIQERRMTKVTVPRLHFSETTLNNQRKNFRPNPEQRYFYLVVRLYASINDRDSVLIQSYASDKVIVRATNPGSFEPPDSDVAWQKNNSNLFTHGSVSVGTDRQAGKLTVDGDIYLTGRVIHPSDIRLKDEIAEKEAKEALENLLKLRVVDYQYKPEVAEKWGLSDEQRKRTGLIAQELAAVLPDAVRDIGDYFTIDESRVFYETVLAMQELCRLNGDLDSKIDDKVDEISRRLSEYALRKKLASSMGSNLNGDNKSLSFSRYSLASTATTITPGTRRRHTRRRRSAIEMEDNQLCSSKFTQGTIMTLVGVMAICLLAMSVLYVLDWHNRNYGHAPVHHATTSSKGAPENLVFSPLRYMPTYQPDAPPLLAHCFSPSCRSYCCGEKPKPVDSSTDDMIKVDDDSKHNKTSGIGRAPQFSDRSFGTGVQIVIPLLNITIDQRYCVEKSCNKRRGVFNLYIPVSKFVPDAPLEVQMIIPRSKIVNNCGHLAEFRHKTCPMSTQSAKEYPTSSQILENTFELSVGSYVQSAYRFRVAYTSDACYDSDEGLKGIFEEYVLIFYRMCSSPNVTIPTTTTPLY